MSKPDAIKNSEVLFEQMSKLLEELIDNARKLRDASSNPIAEEEFDALQKKQQKMVHDLVEIDERAKKNNLIAPLALQKKVEAQLLEFQKINREYVEQLHRKLSLIQFSSPLTEIDNTVEESE